MRAGILVLALAVAACGGGEDSGMVASNRPLHGSAAIIAPNLQPIPHDSLKTVSPSFDAYFEAVGVIELSDEYLLNDISDLEVSREGRFLVRDRRSSEVTLFGPDGGFLAKLDPASCHPGHEGRLGASGFLPDGSILTTAGFDPHMLFDPSGVCRSTWDGPHFSDYTTIGPDGLIYMYFSRPDSIRLEALDLAGKQVRSWNVDVEFPELNRRMRGGGLVVGDDGTAYMTISTDARPRVYRPDSAESRLGPVPELFKAATEDLPRVSGIEALMAAMRNRDPASGAVYLWHLDTDRLLQGSMHPVGSDPDERAEFRILSVDGQVVNHEPIHYRFYLSGFVGTADGVLYRKIAPQLDGGNPILVLYRFTG